MKRSGPLRRKTPIKRTAMRQGSRIKATLRAMVNFGCEDCGMTFERRAA